MFASLRRLICKSQAVLLNLGDPITQFHHCRFVRQTNLKLLSLSVQLERNAWQILATVCSRGTLSSTAPLQADYRRSCNGWHGRAHVSHAFECQRLTNWRQKPETQVQNYAVRPTLQFVVRSTLTRIEGQTDTAQTRGKAGGNGCDITSCSASPFTDMPIQSFETNRQYWAVLRRI